MEITEIISDAVRYPLSDYKKFLIIGLPNLILTILLFILVFQAVGLNELTDMTPEALLASPLFSSFIITTLIFFVALILCLLIINGVGLSVIRRTIKNDDELPSIELGKNIADGIKSLIVGLVYVGVPTIIFFILTMLCAYALGKNSGILILILTLIFIVLMIVIAIISPIAIAKLADTDSIGESLNISEIIETVKSIGFIKIFGVLLICYLINGFISVVGNVLLNIPVLGIFIMTYILYTYMIIVMFRCYGLLYRDRFEVTQPISSYANNQNIEIADKNEYVEKSDENNESVNQDHPLDYPMREDNNEEDKISENNFKKCDQCGFSNPDYSSFCSNCGSKL